MPLNGEYFVFWKHDQYPFFLGGRVLEILADGRARVEGYEGHVFRPVFIVPEEQGIAIRGKLEGLREKWRAAMEELSEAYRKQLAFSIPPGMFTHLDPEPKK